MLWPRAGLRQVDSVLLVNSEKRADHAPFGHNALEQPHLNVWGYCLLWLSVGLACRGFNSEPGKEKVRIISAEIANSESPQQ